MTIRELIEALSEIEREHGDLEVRTVDVEYGYYLPIKVVSRLRDKEDDVYVCVVD